MNKILVRRFLSCCACGALLVACGLPAPGAEIIYGADSDTIDAQIAAACAPGGSRTVTLGKNPVNPDGVWMITHAILLPDNFTLVLDDCRVQLAPGTRDNLIRNAGALGYRRVTPNHHIRVIGKGNAVLCGGCENHYAPTTSGDRNGWRTMGILFCAVTDYELAGFTLEETQCWGITQENGCARGWVHDIRFNDSNKMRNQDGVDVRKGCHDIVIENITGVCGDDVVALTALRQPAGTPRANGKSACQIGGSWPESDDDVHDITIRNIRARCSGGHGIIRLLVQDGIQMHHIAVSNVVDTTDVAKGHPRCQATLRIGDVNYWSIKRNELGDMRDIVVKDVECRGRVGVWIHGPLADATFMNVTTPLGGKKFDITVPLRNVKLDD